MVRRRSCPILGGSRDTASAYQELVGTLIVGMLRQPCGFQGVIQFPMEREPPALDVFPGYVASANLEETIAILVHSEWDETMSQNHHTRQQQANQMHHMFPAY